MFGMPSLQALMLVSTLPILIGFAVVNYKETWWSAMTFFTIFVNSLIVPAKYLNFMYDTWRVDNLGPPIMTSTRDEQPTQADYNNIPRIQAGGMLVYSQSIPRLKIDCIRLFNRTLLDQRNGNLEINMTENFWLKKFEGVEENRWNKIGGRGRADFVDMLDRGVRFGAYKEIGGQGKRVPADWQKIRRLERGEPLPQ